MARGGENDKAADVIDQLGRIISGVLRTAFLTVAAPERTRATHILERFDNAARKVRSVATRASNKNIFNISASRTPERQRLLGHLPTPEQFSDLRKYFAAKAALLSVNQNIGSRIVSHEAQQSIDRPARPRLPFPTRS